MPVPHHEVRAVAPERTESFEDRTWPICLALAVLCAYIVGIISAKLRFDERNLYQSAMTWTVVTVVVTGVLMLLSRSLNRRWLRRGFFLSLVLSMMVNISVLVVLSLMYLADPLRPALVESPRLEEQEDPETKPEFFPVELFEGDDRPVQDLQKPVSTGEPDLAQSDLMQKTTVAANAERTPVDTPTPDREKRPPRPVERAEVTESALREFDSQNALSRQQQLAQPNLAVPTIEDVPSPSQIPVQSPRAAPIEIQRHTAEATDSRNDTSSQSTTEQTARHRQLSRRSEGDQPQLSETAQPTARSRLDEPTRSPRASIAVGSRPTISRETDPESPRPANVLSQRKRTTTPNQTADLSRLVLDGNVQSSAQASRRQPGDEATQLAETPESVPDRRQMRTLSPSRVDANSSQVAVSDPTTASDREARPADTNVARQAAHQLRAEPLDGSVADATMDTQQNRPAEMERAQVSDREPAPQSDDSVAAVVAQRAVAHALVAVSPQIEATVQTSAAPVARGEPAAAPARTAIAKSVEGLAGAGNEANLDRGQAAPQTPVTIASVSARRERATQQTRIGPSIAPQAGSRVPRSLAGAESPTANMQAQPHPSADNLIAATLAAQQATSAAGQTQRQANAPQANQTAQPGQADIDLGPIRTATSDGVRRPAGGGQPQVAQSRANEPVSRPQVGGTPRPALPAPDTAKIVVTPPSQQNRSQGAGIQAAADAVARQASSIAASAGPRVDRSLSPASVQETVRRSGESTPTRSRAVEANISDVATYGGGTQEPVKTPRATPLPVGTTAEQVRVASADQSMGAPEAVPLQSQDEIQRRSTDGVYGPAVSQAVGAIPDTTARDSLAGVGNLHSTRAPANANGENLGPVLVDPEQAGDDNPLDRSTRRAAGLRSRDDVDVPLAGAIATRDPSELQPQTTPTNLAGSVVRRQSGGIVVPAEALEALGGLSTQVAPNIGVRSPQAQPESQLVADSRRRFIRRNVGGPISFDTRVAMPTRAFQTRVNRRGDEPAGGNGRPSRRTEEAIELGLVYLAKQQLADGSWSLDHTESGQVGDSAPTIGSDTAATGLALLSFLGAGYHHHSDDYREVVQQGLAFLIDRQKPDGDLYLPGDENSNRSAWLYSHGIAAIALCEAYGMTQDPQLRDPAQRAVDFIVASQHSRRGGWRYAPGVGSDTSVSGWMVMALRSAELANLKVPRSSWELVEQWLEMAQVSESRRELYRYNPLAPNNLAQGHGRRASRTMTSVGLLMRLYTGWRRDHSNMVLGAEYLRANLPELGTDRKPQRDTYYWYYATQVMFHMRGEYWEAWNRRLHPLLTSSQIQQGRLAGSWDPHLPIPDRWATHGGRLYVTTLNILSLEVYYRHLPIYEDTAR